MDKHDQEKNVTLSVDWWGAWHALLDRLPSANRSLFGRDDLQNKLSTLRPDLFRGKEGWL